MALQKKCRHVKIGAPPHACECVWYAALSVAGKRLYRNVGADYRTARLEHDRLRATLGLGIIEPVKPPAAVVSFRNAAEDWWRRKAPTIAPNTKCGYRAALDLAVEWLDPMQVAGINLATLLDLESDLLRSKAEGGGGYANGTVRLVRGRAIAVLDHAHARGWREEPAPDLRRHTISREQKEPSVLRPDQMELVLGALAEPFRSLTDFTYLTGLRPSEAIAVFRGDVENDELVVRRNRIMRTSDFGPTKGRMARTVDLSVGALAALALGLGEEPVWPVAYNTWLARFQDALALVGLPRCGLHSLRHSNAALRLSVGQPLPYVAQQLGHASAAFTLRVYGRWIPSERDQAALLDAGRASHLAARSGGKGQRRRAAPALQA